MKQILVLWGLALLSFHPLLGQVTTSDFSPRSQGSGGMLFEKLSPDRTGLRLINPIDITHPLKRLYVGGYASGGLAIGDVDGDGLQDIFAVGTSVKNDLYLQEKDAKGGPSLRFTDVTVKVPGMGGGELWGAGAALADIDNDGDLDLYICHHDAPNHLFLNETQVPGTPIFT
ncbi:MAG: FG-GAP repeat domain-containing protein, partial [Verrucomicrobiales bacterium]